MIADLTPREMVVFLLTCEGLERDEIVKACHVGRHIVKGDLIVIGNKLKTDNRPAWLRIALRHGLKREYNRHCVGLKEEAA